MPADDAVPPTSHTTALIAGNVVAGVVVACAVVMAGLIYYRHHAKPMAPVPAPIIVRNPANLSVAQQLSKITLGSQPPPAPTTNATQLPLFATRNPVVSAKGPRSPVSSADWR